VVDLVLDAYGEQTIGLGLEGFAFFVQGANFHTLRARHLLVNSGYGQAAFLVHLLAVAFENHRVDQRHQARPVLADVDDDHALMDVDLRRGQADTGRLVHGSAMSFTSWRISSFTSATGFGDRVQGDRGSGEWVGEP
jgi:hypothetical protein